MRVEARATARYQRISPYKARLAANLIRGRSVQEAEAILRFTPKKAAALFAKVLRSAVANAENNLNLDRRRLVVSQAYVDEGPTLKRIRPRARGMAHRIRKRTSHITVVVSEKR
ncbi:MAG: 50S ribosomal protein L22 [Limnochorda sp.]|jgi:ribosomal protein L22, bacterial type